jgi:arylsulfatase A-like enzyme
MAHDKDEDRGLSRRAFIQDTGLTALALGAGTLAGIPTMATAAQSTAKAAGSAGGGPYNILFILTDQERYLDPSELPPGYALPGRERLQRRGVTFTNHHINSAVCTSSRSVIYTGQHIQHTKLFDNMDVPWMKDLSHDIPTLGDMLSEAGYYAAYKGKWHMSKELGTHDEQALPQEKLTQIIESYGFKDYVGIGDVIGMTQGGYINDDIIGAQAQRWLRVRGQPMNQQGKPWFQAVNLVNPHDVMFYNTDAPGQNVQGNPKTMMPIARDPDTPLYRQQWDVQLPKSRHEPFDAKGRPRAHWEYQLSRGALVGNFPDEDVRWRRLLNYYFNCIHQSDRVVEGILDELDALGLADNTIVVMMADHGELGGAHGTHGKGTTAYREQNHVPLIISHPGYPATHGQRCGAVTSHLDLAPTLIDWTGVDAGKHASITRKLHGKNLTPLLEKGATAGVNDVRAGSLYCFNMFMYNDSNLTLSVQAYLNAGGDPKKIGQQGFKPDLTKRGAIRSVFDGRYKYSRYFSPKQHNQPRTLEGIFELNDVELFDLQADPDEMQNLATEPKKHGDLLLAMNAKMNTLIDTEVDEPDNGSFLPGKHANWAATTFDP